MTSLITQNARVRNSWLCSLQVAKLQTELEARKEAHTQLEEENKSKEEVNQNLEVTLNELNKKIIVSIYCYSKHYECMKWWPNQLFI